MRKPRPAANRGLGRRTEDRASSPNASRGRARALARGAEIHGRSQRRPQETARPCSEARDTATTQEGDPGGDPGVGRPRKGRGSAHRAPRSGYQACCRDAGTAAAPRAAPRGRARPGPSPAACKRATACGLQLFELRGRSPSSLPSRRSGPSPGRARRTRKPSRPPSASVSRRAPDPGVGRPRKGRGSGHRAPRKGC